VGVINNELGAVGKIWLVFLHLKFLRLSKEIHKLKFSSAYSSFVIWSSINTYLAKLDLYAQNEMRW